MSRRKRKEHIVDAIATYLCVVSLTDEQQWIGAVDIDWLSYQLGADEIDLQKARTRAQRILSDFY